MFATPTTDSRWSLPPILPLLDEGLGNQAYLVDLGDGRALALDPTLDRDLSTRPLQRTS